MVRSKESRSALHPIALSIGLAACTPESMDLKGRTNDFGSAVSEIVSSGDNRARAFAPESSIVAEIVSDPENHLLWYDHSPDGEGGVVTAVSSSVEYSLRKYASDGTYCTIQVPSDAGVMINARFDGTGKLIALEQDSRELYTLTPSESGWCSGEVSVSPTYDGKDLRCLSPFGLSLITNEIICSLDLADHDVVRYKLDDFSYSVVVDFSGDQIEGAIDPTEPTRVFYADHPGGSTYNTLTLDTAVGGSSEETVVANARGLSINQVGTQVCTTYSTVGDSGYYSVQGSCSDSEETTTETDTDADGFPVEEDCDDSDASAYPGAEEVCDEADNDCDGETDEDARDAGEWYQDADGDESGNADSSTVACEQPKGYVDNSDDPDDADPTVTNSAPMSEFTSGEEIPVGTEVTGENGATAVVTGEGVTAGEGGSLNLTEAAGVVSAINGAWTVNNILSGTSFSTQGNTWEGQIGVLAVDVNNNLAGQRVTAEAENYCSDANLIDKTDHPGDWKAYAKISGGFTVTGMGGDIKMDYSSEATNGCYQDLIKDQTVHSATELDQEEERRGCNCSSDPAQGPSGVAGFALLAVAGLASARRRESNKSSDLSTKEWSS